MIYIALKSPNMGQGGYTQGQISGTGIIKFSGKARLFGGAIITADGTNAAVVVIRKDSDVGDIIFNANTKNSLEILRPFYTCGAEQIHYSITGTGATAQLFEYEV